MLWADKGGLTLESYNYVIKERAKVTVMKRLKLNTMGYEEIEWEVHGRAIKRVQTRYRTQVLRLIWDEVPTQAKLKRNGYVEDNRCKLCGKEDTTAHFLSCEGGGIVERRTRLLGNMKSQLRVLGVNPYLTCWLMETMTCRVPKLQTAKPLSL